MSQPTPIMVIHQRYEQACEEYHAIDSARSKAAAADDVRGRCFAEQAADASMRETDALRVAILHQVPTSRIEAVILQYHIVETLDMSVNCEGRPQVEADALSTAVETLFDFLCCETAENTQLLGRMAGVTAKRTNRMRLARTGQVES